MELYIDTDQLNTFNEISSYSERSTTKPFGYHFRDHIWSYVYSSNTKNKIGKIIMNNDIHNIDNTDNYDIFCNIRYVIFIESEYPIGTIELVYSFKSLNNTSMIPNTITNKAYPTVVNGSISYYLQNMKASMYNSDSLLNINIILLTFIPKTITSSQLIEVYYNGSQFSVFRDISDYSETSVKTPFGYHFRDAKWSYVYSNITKNIIGIILAFNNYHRTIPEIKGGYCNIDVVLFIFKEYPVGSFGYTLNFFTPTNTTNFISGTTVYPTITSLTGDYYGKNVTVKVIIDGALIRYNYFTVRD